MPLRGARTTRNDKDPLWRRTTLDSSFALFRRDNSVSDQQRHSSDVSAPDSGGTASSQDGLRPDQSIPIRRMSAFTDSRPTPPASPEPPPSPPIQPSTPQTKRFSLLRFRHASDPQLSTRAKEHAGQEKPPPLPAILPGEFSKAFPKDYGLSGSIAPLPAPQIITTAPTMDTISPQKKKLRFQSFTRGKPQAVVEVDLDAKPSTERRRLINRKSTAFGSLRSRISFADEAESQDGQTMPAPNGDVPRLSLALPFRKSESNRYDREPRINEENESRTSLSYSKSTLGWLPRRNHRNRQSLFPLAHLQPAQSSTTGFGSTIHPITPTPTPEPFSHTLPATPRASTSRVSFESRDGLSGMHTPHSHSSPSRHQVNGMRTEASTNAPSPAHAAALVGSSISFAGPAGVLFRTQSSASTRSTPDLPPPKFRMFRNRSSTVNSTGDRSEDGAPPTPPLGSVSGRNSTSTTGRSSFGNLLGLPRFRGSSEQTPRHGSPGLGSSYNLAPEPVLPAREDGETALSYLERLEDLVEKRLIARLLSKAGDDFSLAVLRSHMRKFAFFGDPLDMAIRKLLMFVELPPETQQIDRVLNGFADRYYECNPGIFVTSEQAYFMTFSILMLHTDIFNKNNKRKMTKPDYVKIATEQDSDDTVAPDILACFYDNIVYTPFIRVEDDLDRKSTGSRGKRKRKAIQKTIPEPVKTKEPIDPYTLILESKLDNLRPAIRDVLLLDDPYNFLAPQNAGPKRLQRPPKYGIIQITSLRSRPDAWKNQSTIENPDEAQAGIVDLPVHKIGILRRKNPKRKTARKTWEEWGVILTDSELRFTKDTHVIYKYVKQYQKHVEEGHGDSPIVFEPALDHLPADAQFPVTKCVALIDSNYKKHKNAFVMFPDPQNDKGVFEEIFLAESESDMNDWLERINYQAAYKSAGIMPRGLVGGHYEGQRQRGLRRLESANGTTSPLDQIIQTPTGEVTVRRGKIDRLLAEQMGQARREAMAKKIAEAEDKISTAIRRLDYESRNARHLMIVAPIQQKTRNDIVHAAGRMSQRLKFSRVDVWRMKCHRDILAMDLEEERRRSLGPAQILRANEIFNQPTAQTEQTVASSSASANRPKSSQLDRLGSKGSGAGSALSVASPPPSAHRPTTAESQSTATETEDDYDFHTPPELSDVASQRSTRLPLAHQMSPPSIRTLRSERRGSLTSQTASSFAQDLPDPILGSSDVIASPASLEPHQTSTSITAAETTSVNSGTDNQRPETPTESGPAATMNTGSPHSKPKVRRALQRTLRHASSDSPHSHQKSRKGKESISTMGTVDTGDDEPEQLPRAIGSFNLHGKKASVITFGDEWTSMSAEERLQSRRAIQASSVSLTAPSDEQFGESGSISEGRTRPRTGSQSTATTGVPSLRSKPSRTMSIPEESLRVPSGSAARERRGTTGSHGALQFTASPVSTPGAPQARRESNFSVGSEQSGLERVTSPPIRAS